MFVTFRLAKVVVGTQQPLSAPPPPAPEQQQQQQQQQQQFLQSAPPAQVPLNFQDAVSPAPSGLQFRRGGHFMQKCLFDFAQIEFV